MFPILSVVVLFSFLFSLFQNVCVLRQTVQQSKILARFLRSRLLSKGSLPPKI